MYKVQFKDVFGTEWQTLPVVALGKVMAEQSAVAHVAVINGEVPKLRIDIYADDDCFCFQDVRIINQHLVIGYGSFVHFVNLDTLKICSCRLTGYFGHLYTPDEFGLENSHFDILVASASDLMRFNKNGDVIWHTKDVGIDGVLVNNISGNLLFGCGEFDPPGGWTPFRLNLQNGLQTI